MQNVARHEIVIVGAGAAGISVAAGLLARSHALDIALIDPATTHYYQPGWTLVGGGVFRAETTARPMASVLPRGVTHIAEAAIAFEPEVNTVRLADGRAVEYRQLIVCPGIELDWNGIEGLTETLGRNGVTSNYRYDLAPYTWQLVQQMKRGSAVFTQPPIPIKCAGAPQKAMYLSADHWRRMGCLKNIEIAFYSAAPALFSVAAYIPALMEYIQRYNVDLNLGTKLVAVDGDAKRATFTRSAADNTVERFTRDFDMLHVTPPQRAPAFVRASPLADAVGWIDVNPDTLAHKRYANIHALGDAINTTNSKTAGAVRKQAPVVAHNVLAALGKARGAAIYDGYGACPLTVERGRVVLAEFLYGGKLAPSFPLLNEGTRATRLAWMLKTHVLPFFYWNILLRGREWLVKPPVNMPD
ncbi:MAG: NAD(P)/FAD-dependent oxidoreductase [Methylobacillus sp.]|jgi:sulfide:quinone oxidoreductase|nr:NAD(P)/FAD-dependent oxidoreductase [Methylobacillus sp.]